MNKNIFTRRTLFIALVVGLVAIAAIFFFKSSSKESTSDTAARSAEIWTCSMHPQIRMNKPGKCPICSMPLVRASNPVAKNESSNVMFTLSEHARLMASVETVAIERRRLSREIRVVGKVQYNETALANITARVDGYVERLFVNYTGIEVKRGDHLVEIYSPDLVTAQQELLIALEGERSANVDSAKLKLLRWGLTQEQVDELVRNKKMHERLTLFSPIKGTVTEKMVFEKSAVKPGDVLYRLANLESVWVYLDVYEFELSSIRYGQNVELTSEAYPGESFNGRVWLINPVLNEETRTIKVLLNISNAEQKLKPGMFVSAVIRSELLADGKPAPSGVEGQWSCPMHPEIIRPQSGKCPVCEMPLVQIPGAPATAKSGKDKLSLAVPVSAVLDSGVRELVYVEKLKGEFVPAEIVIGPRAGDFYPVLSGLKEGDRVAARGNFLLDSQFQIQGLPSLFYPEGQAGMVGHQHGDGGPARKSKSNAHEAHAPPPPEHKH